MSYFDSIYADTLLPHCPGIAPMGVTLPISTRSNKAKVVGIIMRYQALYSNKEKDYIAPPRENYVYLLDRGWVQYGPTRTAHSIRD